jgi:hypothetical protein
MKYSIKYRGTLGRQSMTWCEVGTDFWLNPEVMNEKIDRVCMLIWEKYILQL